MGVQRAELLSRFGESLLAELQAEVVAMSFACALGLFCVLRSDVALPICSAGRHWAAQVKSAAAPSPTPRREEAYDRPLLGPGCLPRSPDKTRLRICKSISRLRNHRHSQPPQPIAAVYATPGLAQSAAPTVGSRSAPPRGHRTRNWAAGLVPSTLTRKDAHRKGRPAARAADDRRRDRPVLGGEQGRRYDG